MIVEQKRGLSFSPYELAGVLIPWGNSIFFTVSAGFVGFLIYLGMYHPQSIISADGEFAPVVTELMLGTFGLLILGLLYSFFVIKPLLRRQRRERTQLNQKTQNLAKQATTDALTGLHNRRYFEEAMKNYLAEFNKMDAKLGLLILDLDHFKSVNDNYGHDVGDLVLREVALRMRANVREHDIVARMGGEEFAILTPYIEREQLLQIAERFRELIADLKIKHGNVVLKPTVSIGVATNENGEHIADDLYKAADLKLYEAKHNGRNRVAA